MRPLLPAAILLPVETLGLAGIVLWRHSYPGLVDDPQFPLLFMIALGLWLVGFLLAMVAAACGPAIAVTRAAPSERVPGVAAQLVLPLAVLLSVAAATSALATVVMAPDSRDWFSLAFTIVIATGGLFTSVPP